MMETPVSDSTRDRDAQWESFASAAYMHPAYSEARVTRSHQAAMLAGMRAVRDEAHDVALAENARR